MKTELVSKLKELKLIINEKASNLYKAYLLMQNQKRSTISEVHLKQMFFLRLYDEVEKLDSKP